MVDAARNAAPPPKAPGTPEAWEEFHLVRARDLIEEAGAKPRYGGPSGLPED
jgi:hypothetical protein